MSDKYLKRMGRTKMTPEHLLKYEEERKRRMELRKQIVEDLESKELTFKPQLSEKSIRLQVCQRITSPFPRCLSIVLTHDTSDM